MNCEKGTLATHLEQVARNLRKALAQGRRILVVVDDREDAETFARVLKKDLPEAEIWRDVGIIWREGVETMTPADFGPRKPWGFLPGGSDDDDGTDLDASEHEMALAAADDPSGSDLARVAAYTKQFREAGRLVVTATDFGELIGDDHADSLTLRRLGMALSTLGVRSRRVMRNGLQVREYDLTSLADDRPGPGSKPWIGSKKPPDDPAQAS